MGAADNLYGLAKLVGSMNVLASDLTLDISTAEGILAQIEGIAIGPFFFSVCTFSALAYHEWDLYVCVVEILR